MHDAQHVHELPLVLVDALHLHVEDGVRHDVDGQVLVVHDMLGINNAFNPRFLRKYNNLHEQMSTAFKAYNKDVQSGDFPNETEQY